MLRHVLILIAVVAVLGVAACGDDDEGSSRRRAHRADTGTQTETSPPEEALKDTSTKPEIPKPTGSPPRKLVKQDIVKGTGPAAKPGDTVIVNYVGMNFSNGWSSTRPGTPGSPSPCSSAPGA